MRADCQQWQGRLVTVLDYANRSLGRRETNKTMEREKTLLDELELIHVSEANTR